MNEEEKLNTIQREEISLNTVYTQGDMVNNAHHKYIVKNKDGNVIQSIQFQQGPRSEKGSVSGVCLLDLLEISRNMLSEFQQSEYRTRENAVALTHIEEAIMWLNRRAEERNTRHVLGKNIK